MCSQSEVEHLPLKEHTRHGHHKGQLLVRPRLVLLMLLRLLLRLQLLTAGEPAG
ncbi:hypothetical protein Nocox_12350 [Nonomuraea coxensis DSM 45129]|uniref:Transposase n=1 Tax=Nonomuraea coxensis DSM 45129 TaxID=1122611 RepID=A0ABX8TXT2_9ACTN|nr:hypothetical protein [Nonomuraea coxensis]QYC40088.1 hypothetical protein Nocox_12350 [Nonomuraea coxensis DSM 45129]